MPLKMCDQDNMRKEGNEILTLTLVDWPRSGLKSGKRPSSMHPVGLFTLLHRFIGRPFGLIAVFWDIDRRHGGHQDCTQKNKFHGHLLLLTPLL